MPQRLKVGLIMPSSNTTVEYDFQRLVPEGVSLHSARLWLTGADAEAARAMNAELETAAKHLGSADLDLIVYACTGGSLDGGTVAERLRAHVGAKPIVATTPAVRAALDAMRLKRLSVATPYQPSMTEMIGAYLERAGYQVLSIAGREKPDNLAIGNDRVEDIIAFAARTLHPDADGLFLSCTNWHGLDAVERLEQLTGKPVVTSNQATIWAALCALGAAPRLPGFGRLMQTAPSRRDFAA